MLQLVQQEATWLIANKDAVIANIFKMERSECAPLEVHTQNTELKNNAILFLDVFARIIKSGFLAAEKK